jgi:hypothetical protein
VKLQRETWWLDDTVNGGFSLVDSKGDKAEPIEGQCARRIGKLGQLLKLEGGAEESEGDRE